MHDILLLAAASVAISLTALGLACRHHLRFERRRHHLGDRSGA